MDDKDLMAYEQRIEELLVAQHETMMEDPELYQ